MESKKPNTNHSDNSNYEKGRLVSFSGEEDIPISVEQCWSAFDDYFSIQKGLAMHADTKQVLGGGRPKNGVGAEIVFSFEGGETRETLWQKDDLNLIWTMGLPEPNVYFDYYRLTFHTWQGDKGPKSRMTIEGIAKGELEQRKQIVDLIETTLPLRLLEVNLFVLNRDGIKSHFEFDLDCPVDKFWDVISDWYNVSWVMGAVGVEKLAPRWGKTNRSVKMPNNGHANEILYECDKATHTLIYYLYDSTGMPITMYQGTMKLVPGATDAKTKVIYDNVFFTKAGVDGNQFKTALETAFNTKNVPFLQEKFKQ